MYKTTQWWQCVLKHQIIYIQNLAEKLNHRLNTGTTVSKFCVCLSYLLYTVSCDIKTAHPTHILTASTQIAANIKVIVIEVAKVIKTNFFCSPEKNKEQNRIMVSWDVCG